jgi:hypothetical protein
LVAANAAALCDAKAWQSSAKPKQCKVTLASGYACVATCPVAVVPAVHNIAAVPLMILLIKR